jgi:tRNA (guanine26-N2/guanine27-N2)-dimethyltransferase
LWLGRLHDREFCEQVLGEVVKREFKSIDKLISTCRDELEIPMHYDIHKVCKMLGITAMSTIDLVSALRERGFQASRTHFSGISFKTDAGMEEIKGVVRELANLNS